MRKIVNLVIYPDLRLKTKSSLVEKFDDDLHRELNNMVMATQIFRGIGLAGVQIGFMKQAIYIDYDSIMAYEDKQNNTTSAMLGKPLFMINPTIIISSDEKFTSKEGCLSLPNIEADVTRSKYVKVEYYNELGEFKSLETEVPLLAACIQHEIDHVNGITIAEYQSKLKRDQISKKIEKYINFNEMKTSFDPSKTCETTGCDHEHHSH